MPVRHHVVTAASCAAEELDEIETLAEKIGRRVHSVVRDHDEERLPGKRRSFNFCLDQSHESIQFSEPKILTIRIVVDMQEVIELWCEIVQVQNLWVLQPLQQFTRDLLVHYVAQVHPGLPLVEQPLRRSRSESLTEGRFNGCPSQFSLEELNSLVAFGYSKSVEQQGNAKPVQ